MPQPTALATTSTTKPVKSSTKTKKKNFAFDSLSSFDLFALLRPKKKKKMKDEEEVANDNSKEEDDDQESKASSKTSVTNNDPYYPYNQELFGHDEATTLDLGEE